ncbi:hypothetical protein F5984_23130 [Rudanella paleaurantiibacter]|uniref:Ig-like domain-containing protein n=1 Tax=Rudanella paleaurantiibacter TaxID=2614655 RepID=A0A7J5TTK7_9BACT|nr:SBBP repeat-containing protein [Rudanella paleaurantiibacter]KAB7727131.1 hypothetical protein F5984_23130 [Rudanella paleaurantiibacter]
MHLKLLLFSLLIAILPPTLSSAQTVNWATLFKNSNEQQPTAIARDAGGNIYVSGYYRDNLTFGATTLRGNTSSFYSFVCKMASNGTVTWAKSFTSTSGANFTNAIAVDNNGAVYVTGYFSNTIDLDPGTPSVPATTAGNNDVFVVKLDTDGNYAWSKQFGSSRAETGTAIAVDNSGNVYVGGSFTGANTTPGSNIITFAPGITTLSNDQPSNDIFTVKLNGSDGTPQWAISLGKSVAGQGEALGGIALAPDGSAIYLTGLFIGELDFDPSQSGVTMLTATATNASQVGQDAFVLKLGTSNGSFIWAAGTSGQPGNFVQISYSTGIKVAPSGNIYAIGNFNGIFDFDPSPSGVTSVSSSMNAAATARSIDSYVWKLNPSGGLVWVKTYGGTGAEGTDGIGLDADENVYITGSFSGVVDFNPNPSVSNTLTSAGNNDPYALKLNVNGDYVQAIRFGGSTLFDLGAGIAPGSTTEATIAGYVNGTSSVSFGTINQTPSGSRDVFVTSFNFPNPCVPPAITQEPPASGTVCAGGSVNTPVTVTGAVTSYQWFKDGVSLGASQNTSTLSLTNTQPGDAGSYVLVATGSCNSATSTAFSLSVNQPAFAGAPVLSQSLVAAGQAMTVNFQASQINCGFPPSGPFVIELATSPTPTTLTVSGISSQSLITVTPTSLPAGSYQLRIGYNNQVYSPYTTLIIDSPLSISTVQTTLCVGGTVRLEAIGCEAGVVEWSTGQTGRSIDVAPQSTTTISASCVITSGVQGQSALGLQKKTGKVDGFINRPNQDALKPD